MYGLGCKSAKSAGLDTALAEVKIRHVRGWKIT